MADDTNPQDPPIVTRAEAKAAGKTRYYTGRPCAAGHVVERYVSKRCCVRCSLEQQQTDLKQRRAYNAAYYAAHRLLAQQRTSAYEKANREQTRARCALRRARKLQATGRYSDTDILALFKLQRGKCAHVWCLKSLTTCYHVDHVTPLSRGGANDKRNLQLLCRPCNQKKWSHDPIDFAQRHGVLL